VSSGENNVGLYYDKAILTKAGIKLPWQPKTWQDIITAAQAIKKPNQGDSVVAQRRNGRRPNGAGYGILNMLADPAHPQSRRRAEKWW